MGKNVQNLLKLKNALISPFMLSYSHLCLRCLLSKCKCFESSKMLPFSKRAYDYAFWQPCFPTKTKALVHIYALILSLEEEICTLYIILGFTILVHRIKNTKKIPCRRNSRLNSRSYGITCPGQTGQSSKRIHCLSLSLGQIYEFFPCTVQFYLFFHCTVL